MHKKIVVCLYNAILLSNKKRTTDTRTWKKLKNILNEKARYKSTFYNSKYIKFKNTQN